MNDLTRTMTTSSGIRSAVCHWLVEYLRDPSKFYARPARSMIRFYNGRMAVNARALIEEWNLYQTQTQAPQARRIAAAIAGTSSSCARFARCSMS